ncbi:MAG: hypothetical protein RIQ60_1507 [Pseudomonadota bacterium]|jgi:PAS domain S-box-containing protein
MPSVSLSRPYRSFVLILAASYALLVLAVAVAGRRMIDEIRDVESQARALYEHPFRANAACHEARLAASLIRSELLFVQMERTPTGLHLRLDVDELDHQLEAQLDLVEQFYLGDQQQVSEARTLTGRWRERRIALMRMLDAGRYDEARALTLSEISPLHDAVMQRLDAITDVTRLRGAFYAEEAHRKAAESVQRMWTLLGLLVVGTLVGASGVTMLVVGQLRRRDRELAHERERIRLLADNVPGLATVLLDTQGRIQTWNEGARRLHGFEASEIIGQPIDRLYSAEQAAGGKTARVLALAQANGFHEDMDWRVRKDGSRLFADVIFCPLRDEGGQLLGFLKISRDISERHRLEQDLIAARDRAEAANRAKSGFLANMSHEVRTPLNAIIGLTQLVLDSPLNAEQRDFLGKVQRSSRALLGVLNDLLDYSKIEAGHLEFEVIDMSVEDVLHQSADLFMASIEHKGLEIYVDIDPALPRTVRGDPLRLAQVLNNLVGNAVKFTHQGEIRLRVDCVGTLPAGVAGADGAGATLAAPASQVELRFTVSDTGIGIAPGSVDHLFQAFAQADESVTRKYGGTGLGLAICRNLVSLMGGQIEVQSEPDHGSSFIFTARFEARPDAESSRGLGRAGLPERLRVLVVDDQDSSRQLLKRNLSNWNWDVVCEDSAEAGLARLRQPDGPSFDLVLVDWIMPGTDGLNMARSIDADAAAGLFKRPPRVVMVTAHAREQLLQAAQGTALDAVLVKPVLPSTLLAAMQQALARPTDAADPATSAAHDGLVAAQTAALQLPPEPPQTPSSAWRQAAAAIAGRRILLVEDNELSQAVAREFLQRAGLDVTCASNGGEALAAVETEVVDAVLMDLHMPDMDGFEATRRIRALPGRHDLPIIALTAAALQTDRAAAHAAGMNAHLAKPIDPETLIDLLLQWLDPQRRAANAAPAAPATRVQPAAPAAATSVRTTGVAAPAPPAATDLPARAPAPQRRPARLDRAEALARMGGDSQVLAKLLRRFMDSHEHSARLVLEALQRADQTAAIELLHRMAGAAASLGLTDLGRVASRFEVSLRAPETADPAETTDLLGQELADQLGQARALVDAELRQHPARPTRLVLRPNGELQESVADADELRGAADVARAMAKGNAGASPIVVTGLHPATAAAAHLPAATSTAGPRADSTADSVSAAPADASPRAAGVAMPVPDDAADGDPVSTLADPHRAQRAASARRLIGTLEALQPLLRERDLVPRELLDGLERHTEAWAITLDPRAQAGSAGSMADAAAIVETLGVLGDQLDAFDYPQAEQALQLALKQMRNLHA